MAMAFSGVNFTLATDLISFYPSANSLLLLFIFKRIIGKYFGSCGNFKRPTV